MSTEMNATETAAVERIILERRGVPVDFWAEDGQSCRVTYHRDIVSHGWIPNPLADTPEGDHEFMETMRWADARELGRVCLQRMLEYDYALLGGPDFKAAFLEALAAAIKGESMKEARE